MSNRDQNSDLGTILIVDDTLENLQVLGATLRNEGYSLVLAQSGIQALEAAKTSPDLILLDIMMPDMDGYETCERLKKNVETRDIPVCFLTAKTAIADIEKGFLLGAVDYVTKPFNKTELLARCKTHIALRRLQLHLEDLVTQRTLELQKAMSALKGRDELLSRMLYLHDPQETLVMALNLALDLCECDEGALYIADEDGNMKIRTAIGFDEIGITVKEPDRLGLPGEDDPIFEQVLASREVALSLDPNQIHLKYGVHSYGLVPVCRGEEVLAVLELGRRQQSALLESEDLHGVEELLPYVAMAVVDSKLEKLNPELTADVDRILEATDSWTK
ncbi:MAG: response regulator [Candidatus Latescibacterota bacterium]|nr:response regulator [Candidatus Latescibacterota bacterium]